jgi:hypothetical protein
MSKHCAGQLSIFEDAKPKLTVFHIYAVDKFDRHMEDDIEAVSWKQAELVFKQTHGFYWKCHR